MPRQPHYFDLATQLKLCLLSQLRGTFMAAWWTEQGSVNREQRRACWNREGAKIWRRKERMYVAKDAISFAAVMACIAGSRGSGDLVVSLRGNWRPPLRLLCWSCGQKMSNTWERQGCAGWEQDSTVCVCATTPSHASFSLKGFTRSTTIVSLASTAIGIPTPTDSWPKVLGSGLWTSEYVIHQPGTVLLVLLTVTTMLGPDQDGVS